MRIFGLQNKLGLNSRHKRRLNNFGKAIFKKTASKENLVEEYPEAELTGFTIDYHELRETVRSMWRKRLPTEHHKIIAFVIPRGEITAIDFVSLSHGNYQELLRTLDLNNNHCVFYELEDGYISSVNKDSMCSDISTTLSSDSKPVVFNEYVIMHPEYTATSSCRNSICESDGECPIKLNSILFQ
ncbi:hypothetical protein GGI07_002749 [Coemansia sp. Benny D115]|nr:hypothetical protein GGI07_002749 [Coemansia sp. Benny D115]